MKCISTKTPDVFDVFYYKNIDDIDSLANFLNKNNIRFNYVHHDSCISILDMGKIIFINLLKHDQYILISTNTIQVYPRHEFKSKFYIMED